MQKNIKESIVESLEKVIAPETGLSVIAMELVKDLEVKGKKAILKFRPPSPVCPLGIQLAFNIKKAVESVEGVEVVNIKVIDYIRAEELNEMLRKAQHQEK